MSDIAVIYTLATNGGTVVFNHAAVPGIEDVFFITDIRGLDQGSIRTPQDDAPQDDGGLDHDFFGGPMHPFFEGEYVVQSSRIENDIQIIRNEMNAALKAALKSIYRVADVGSITWTEAGMSEVSLPVRCEIPMDSSGVEQKVFGFGLYSSDHEPS